MKHSIALFTSTTSGPGHAAAPLLGGHGWRESIITGAVRPRARTQSHADPFAHAALSFLALRRLLAHKLTAATLLALVYLEVSATAVAVAPGITAVSPAFGPTTGGTSVTITGALLTGATVVKFGGTAATNVMVHSATSLSATAPPGSGTVDVIVTTADGTSAAVNADRYTYVAGPALTILSNIRAGSLLTVDLTTGNRTVMPGSAISGSQALALDPTGKLYVANDDGIRVFDVTTGKETALPHPENVHDMYICGLTFDAHGNLIAGSLGGFIYGINVSTGDCTVLASSSVGSGAAVGEPSGVVVDTDGSIVYIDFSSLTLRLVRLNPTTLVRTVISSSTVGTGSLGKDGPLALARLPNGSFAVAMSDPTAAIITVNPTTGDRTVLSGTSVGIGPPFVGGPSGLAVSSAGALFAYDYLGVQLFEIALATGNRTVIASDSVGTGSALDHCYAMLPAAVPILASEAAPLSIRPPAGRP